jgi:hypothetical protein
MASEKLSFVKWKVYRVVRNFTKFSAVFREGQKLRLIDWGYSSYDGLTIYQFQNLENGEKASLEIADTENFQEWRSLFEDD